MKTLLLRCAGPMQAWGTGSRFGERDTGREPSKSGVVGMVAAALGRERTEPMDDLACLRMGVRVDREGTVLKDFQTAQKVRRADGSGTQDTVVSNRYFLADAVFLVGLEGDDELVARIQAALLAPRWPLFLGRRANPPGDPVALPDGVVDARLEDALMTYPRLVPAAKDPRARLVFEVPYGDPGELRQDNPVSFESTNRRFGPRRVAEHFMDWPAQDRGGEP